MNTNLRIPVLDKDDNEAAGLIAKMLKDAGVRRAVTRLSHYWFFHLYFSHYVKYKTAPFQMDMFDLSEDEKNELAAIIAFRGSGKTSIMTLSYPIWAILGRQHKKHVVILAQTMPQAKQLLKNIREELEKNSLLRQDLGPFQQDDDEWRSYSLVIPKYNARITAASIEQSVRGLRHGPHRPDLIILDDVEDLGSVKTKEARDKIYEWFKGDVSPLGDKHTKIVLIGNLLHQDSLMMKVVNSIKAERLPGVYRFFPLVDEQGAILWPGKYPDLGEVETEKRKIDSEVAWQREYMLKIISSEEQVVKPEWIHYYDGLPPVSNNWAHIMLGIDLAISKEDYSDFTAIVPALVTGYGSNIKIYILPDIVNKRLDFPETVQYTTALYHAMNKKAATEAVVENVGYQAALEQQLTHNSIRASGYKVGGQDKHTRIAMTSHMIKSGMILFPRTGAEQLIGQLVNFGTESHDDLADAFVIAVMSAFEKHKWCARTGVGRVDAV